MARDMQSSANTANAIITSTVATFSPAAYTISIWNFPISSGSNFNPIWSKYNNSSAIQYNCYWNSGSYGCNSFSGFLGSNGNSSAWNHVVLSDGTAGQYGYTNGATMGSNGGSAGPSGQTGLPFVIGNQSNSQFRAFPGYLADCAMWSIQLSTGEMTALFNGARPGSIRSSALIGWWPLYGTVSPEPDISGNAFNGTLTGTQNAPGPPLMAFTPRWPQRAAEAPPVVAVPELQNFTAFVGRRVAVIGY